ncbi:hypothetical protein HanRHA438_Chr12g0545051 [Helianthus annuus]|uniref:DUF7054 domain-containing protein n=2 Tax=Helianthus annuus TaxID=4232 RepID=A0A251T0F5_HELAN|nr:uncharacterized protein At4g22758 [Helianthus annuus]KAF5777269.1 hypothetical protein HanXRQr2_Chr12g0533651 [Helianthus annuus]KAJ0488839.1 hypothetical protein HanHA300_Chr12g0437281 [Helianthus annuus]KAJ0492430.1 hypothetical protein HanIR_Chr12g0574791 [Helianthus annuus]KAJ0504682.1 hypothetical protein HanHA89_Chr12g0461971 [Helianthus annuus]KAJ0674411.1 hypothetical protein HanLR1_Chr12g0439621 [Helianthus annuus]
MLMYKQKKNQAGKGVGRNRLLISITVIGSAGPIRFVVNAEEVVASVMDTALKSYAREGRLPVLGSNINEFVLYCPIAGTEALSPVEAIGSFGVRNFMLCKKPQAVVEEVGDGKPVTVGITRKNSGSWKSWFNKSLNLKVSTH